MILLAHHEIVVMILMIETKSEILSLLCKIHEILECGQVAYRRKIENCKQPTLIGINCSNYSAIEVSIGKFWKNWEDIAFDRKISKLYLH